MALSANGWAADQYSTLAQRLGPSVRWHEPLARHTSLRVGGPAQLFFVAKSREDLVLAATEAASLGIPWRVIGSASNLLVSEIGLIFLITISNDIGEVRADTKEILIRVDIVTSPHV